MIHGEYHADGTDIQTDGRRIVTLRFLLDAASVITLSCVRWYATAYLSWTLQVISNLLYWRVVHIANNLFSMTAYGRTPLVAVHDNNTYVRTTTAL